MTQKSNSSNLAKNNQLIFTLVSLLFLLYLYLIRTTLYPNLFNFCRNIFFQTKTYFHNHLEEPIIGLIFILFAIGSLLSFIQIIVFFISTHNLNRRLTSIVVPAKLDKIISRLNLSKTSVQVVLSQRNLAFTLGIFSPRIILSTSLINNLTQPQLEAVCLHELYHLKHHHLLWKLIFQIINLFLFFIPLVKYFYVRFIASLEILADAFVIRQQSTNLHIAQALAFKLDRTKTFSLGFNHFFIESRVASILHSKASTLNFSKPHSKQLVFSLISLVFIFLTLSFNSSTNFSQHNSCQTSTYISNFQL